MSPAFTGGFLNTGPPGKSNFLLFLRFEDFSIFWLKVIYQIVVLEIHSPFMWLVFLSFQDVFLTAVLKSNVSIFLVWIVLIRNLCLSIIVWGLP